MGHRFYNELSDVRYSRFRRNALGSNWDPRGKKDIDRIEKQRVSDEFRRSLKSGVQEYFTWPGLQAAQVSWMWLELLDGLHDDDSYDGDFSWVFSRLYNILAKTPASELHYISGMAPYFFVVGNDRLGATFMMNQLVERGKDHYNSMFWSAYYALENLRDNKLAASLYEKASKFPQAPSYLPFLASSLRLRGFAAYSKRERAAILYENMSPELLKILKEKRPELFSK